MRFWSAALCVTLLAGRLFATDVVSTTNMDPGYTSSGFFTGVGYTDPNIGYTNEAAGQTFIPEVGGMLTKLSATVDHWQGGRPLLVSIYTGDVNGHPNFHLGTVSIPETEVLNFGDEGWPLSTFDLSELNIDLNPGRPYVVTFRAEDPLFQNIRYRALRTAVNPNSYGISSLLSPDFGETWQNSSSAPELGLIVCVGSDVPDPQEVAIDVDPKRSKNMVNLKTKNPKPLEVAVLGDDTLDVGDIVADSALLGDPEGFPVEPIGVDYRDVDDDGDGDIVYTFDVDEMKAAGAISESTTSLQLVAYLGNGGLIFGSDAVNQKGGNGQGPKN